jgi:hypothetical protein
VFEKRKIHEKIAKYDLDRVLESHSPFRNYQFLIINSTKPDCRRYFQEVSPFVRCILPSKTKTPDEDELSAW